MSDVVPHEVVVVEEMVDPIDVRPVAFNRPLSESYNSEQRLNPSTTKVLSDSSSQAVYSNKSQVVLKAGTKLSR